ncbi:hypothetical protein DFJ74DRAFT_706225 [Hyaloraphidium curvatum]|nr:hypothetical protein DFJ74DRAFT_706225 [Hyaloraphidium curvatum]
MSSRQKELLGAIVGTFVLQLYGVLFYGYLVRDPWVARMKELKPGWEPQGLDQTLLSLNLLLDLLKCYLIAVSLRMAHFPPLVPAAIISAVLSLGGVPQVLARQSLYEGADRTLQLMSLAYDLSASVLAGCVIWAAIGRGPVQMSPPVPAKKAS